MVEFVYNNTTQASTKTSPFFANYGFHPHFNISIPTTLVNPSAEVHSHSLEEVHKNLALELSIASEQYKVQADRHQ